MLLPVASVIIPASWSLAEISQRIPSVQPEKLLRLYIYDSYMIICKNLNLKYSLTDTKY